MPIWHSEWQDLQLAVLDLCALYFCRGRKQQREVGAQARCQIRSGKTRQGEVSGPQPKDRTRIADRGILVGRKGTYAMLGRHAIWHDDTCTLIEIKIAKPRNSRELFWPASHATGR